MPITTLTSTRPSGHHRSVANPSQCPPPSPCPPHPTANHHPDARVSQHSSPFWCPSVSVSNSILMPNRPGSPPPPHCASIPVPAIIPMSTRAITILKPTHPNKQPNAQPSPCPPPTQPCARCHPDTNVSQCPPLPDAHHHPIAHPSQCPWPCSLVPTLGKGTLAVPLHYSSLLGLPQCRGRHGGTAG